MAVGRTQPAIHGICESKTYFNHNNISFFNDGGTGTVGTAKGRREREIPHNHPTPSAGGANKGKGENLEFYLLLILSTFLGPEGEGGTTAVLVILFVYIYLPHIPTVLLSSKVLEPLISNGFGGKGGPLN